MQTGKNIFSKCILFVFIFLLTAISAFCADNSLSGIDVTRPDGYKVLLKLDKKVQIKKLFNKEGELILILNNTLPSESLEIVYDNAEGLNNVIVQKKGTDNTLILLQGKDIENSEIYTKELLTGVIKPINTKDSILDSLFFVTDKKILTVSVLCMIMMFLMMLFSRPKRKRYIPDNTSKTVKTKHINANTLRNKNLIQSRNIPSIGYNINGSFNVSSAYMSIPEKTTVNRGIYADEEEIRKAG